MSSDRHHVAKKEAEENKLEGLCDFSKLIEVLRTKFLPQEEFAKLVSSEDRVRFCLEKPDILSGFKAFTTNPAIVRIATEAAKSDDKAKNFRLEGNKCFKIKKYKDALKLYSKALLVASFPVEGKAAPSGNGNDASSATEISLAFANRSATLFQMNMFKDCLQNVEHSIEFGYTPSQMHTLLLRKALCLKALEKYPEAREALHESLSSIDDGKENKSTADELRKFVESSYENFDVKAEEKIEAAFYKRYGKLTNASPKLPNASNWVKMSYCQSKGRSLKAKREVGKDENIIVEKPFVAVLSPQYTDSYCLNCCQELGNRLYPCLVSSLVSFCSKECHQEAWETFHKLETRAIGALQASGVLRLSLRILLKAGLQEAIQVATDPESRSKEKQFSTSYHRVYNLCDHSKELSYLVSARQTLAAAYLAYVSSEHLKIIESSDSSYFRIGGLILKHIHQISVNSIVIYNQPIVPGPHDIMGIDVKNQVVGTGIYPTVALVNHSCIPNSEQFYVGSTIYLKTKKKLAIDEEITFSYGPTYKRMSRSERMETLHNQYYFRCDCPACGDALNENFDTSKFQPILTESYYCKCRGPLLINSEADAKCIKCGESPTVEEAKEYLDKSEASKKIMNVGKALIQFGRGQEAEKQYVKALNNLTKICFPEHRLVLAASIELVYVYIFMENIESARKICDECNRIKKLTFGPESSELMHGQLQLLNLRWTSQKKFDANSQPPSNPNRTVSMNKRIISKLVQESEVAVNRIKETVRNSQTSFGLVCLDSSLVSCLKELVELEKHLKANASSN
ncbi:SET and MYND domain-containing protein 4 [Halotydeus destructor]|nr:SET and MYND domain-containing protein 4 [Halotydeus destructor]